MLRLIKKKFSTEVVRIKYSDIKTKNSSEFYEIIKNAYGKDGLGLMVIENVPQLEEMRKRFFKTIYQLAHLDDKILNGLENKHYNYSVGWSKGAESFEDVVDVNKGSFYALVPNSSGKTNYPNVWPKEIPTLENNFLDVANLIVQTGLILSKHIDNYIQSIYPSYETDKAYNHIKNSNFNIGRLLYYYPGQKNAPGTVQNWCGSHNDHGSLTGLTKAMYFDHKTGEIASESFKKTGLYIQSRKGELIKANYGDSDLAYQIGESLQVISGGLLHATPHCVNKYDDINEGIGRVTFALFMQPNKDALLDIPKESSFSNIETSKIYKVPKIQDRIKPGMTFGDFDKATVNSYYNL